MSKKEVTVIDAFVRTRQILRVAAYIRVSSKSEDQENSYQAQMTHYQTLFAYDPNIEMTEIYADVGITGTSL